MLTWHHLEIVAGFGLGLLLTLRLIQQRQRPSVTLAWFVVMVLLPYVGVPLFVPFAGRKLRTQDRRKHPVPSSAGEEAPAAHAPAETSTSEHAREAYRRLLARSGAPPLRGGNQMDLLLSGEDAHARLFRVFREARRSIHLSTFLVADDEVGRELVAVLAERARDGVEGRVLLDAVGCWPTRGGFFDPLRRAGGSVAVFLPATPWHRHWSTNLRNHRKIAVVDGEVAWTGGMNFAEEYLGPNADPDRWVDASALLRGPAVADLHEVFRRDWEYTTGEHLAEISPPPAAGSERLQVLPSGPDVFGDPLNDAILALIAQTRSSICIVTPYFVPDDTLLRALLLQARMGREVLLVLPERSNHRLADLARRRFLQDLLEAGATVRLVPEKMVHAKLLVFDHERAIFGSANVDMRSLYLNFEVSVILEDGPALRGLEAWARALAEPCPLLEAERPRFLARVLADASSLIAPLL